MSIVRSNIDWDRLRKARAENVRKAMAEKGVDAVLLTAFDLIRYVTDLRPLFTPSVYIDGYVAVMTKEGDTMASGPFVEGGKLGYAEEETMPPVYLPSPSAAQRWAKIFKGMLRKLGVTSGRVGVDYFPLAVYKAAIDEMPSIEFTPFLDEILVAKTVKYEEEVELLREAASIVDLGVEAGYEAIEEGKRENRS